MQPMYYIGLDVHKREISFCVKDASGKLCAEGSLSATRLDLGHWMKTLPQPWSAAMEATMPTIRVVTARSGTSALAHPFLRFLASALSW